MQQPAGSWPKRFVIFAVLALCGLHPLAVPGFGFHGPPPKEIRWVCTMQKGCDKQTSNVKFRFVLVSKKLRAIVQAMMQVFSFIYSLPKCQTTTLYLNNQICQDSVVTRWGPSNQHYVMQAEFGIEGDESVPMVKEGNETADWSAKYMILAEYLDIYSCLERPSGSILDRHPEIVRAHQWITAKRVACLLDTQGIWIRTR